MMMKRINWGCFLRNKLSGPLFACVLLFSCDRPFQEYAMPDLEKATEFDIRSSLNILNESILEHPDRADTYFKKALLLLRMGNTLLAEENLFRALSIDEVNPNYQILLAKIYYDGGKFSSARYQSRLLIEKGIESESAYIILTNTYIQDDMYGEAFNSINEATRLNPGNPRLYYLKGIVACEMNNLDLAIENFERSITLDRNEESYKQLVQIYLDQDSFDIATEWIGEALQRYGDNYGLHEQYVRLQLALNRDSIVFGHWNKMSEMFPDRISDIQKQAGHRLIERNQLDSAASLLNLVLERDSVDAEALYMKGLMEERSDRVYAALGYFNQSIAIDSTDGDVIKGRQRVLRKITYLQNLQRELEEIKQIQRIEPRKIQNKE
jgi:tetratricopeptide (TPR) repeat protein